MNCRRTELSVRWTVGEMIVGEMIVGEMIVGEMIVGEMTVGEIIVGEMNCRRNELSAKWTVGEIIVGEMRCRWNDCRWNAGLPFSQDACITVKPRYTKVSTIQYNEEFGITRYFYIT